MKLGAEPKKVVLLAVLLLLAIVLFLYNSGGSEAPSSTLATSPAAVRETAAAPPAAASVRLPRTIPSGERGTIRMRPVTAETTKGEVDPTLRLEWLERLRAVKPASTSRSLFELGHAPAVVAPAPPVTIIPKPLEENATSGTAANAQPATSAIPLKFYGYVQGERSSTGKRGFFLDGDEVIVAGEGDTIKQHYRIVQLSTSGAVIEDTTTKNQQTVPLTPELVPPGG